MKKIIRILLPSIMLNLCMFSQNISTVGEIYDFEVGDIFHEEMSAYSFSGWTSLEELRNYEITNKWYSQNMDTVFYEMHLFMKSISTDDDDYTYTDTLNTVFYTNLNSLINEDIDSVYSADTLYNSRKINVADPWTGTFVEGCGRVYRYMYQQDNFENLSQLIYYKKGTEEWGEQKYVSINEQNSITDFPLVYPNPTSSFIRISDKQQTQWKYLLYDLNGNVLKKGKSYGQLINLQEYQKGNYFLILKNGKKTYNYEIIKK